MIATDEPDKIKLGLKTEKHDSGLWEPLQSNKEIPRGSWWFWNKEGVSECTFKK